MGAYRRTTEQATMTPAVRFLISASHGVSWRISTQHHRTRPTAMPAGGGRLHWQGLPPGGKHGAAWTMLILAGCEGIPASRLS